MAQESIKDVVIGRKVLSYKNGNGLVTAKTKRTIKVTFENGNIVKNTYRYADAYFYESDF